MHTDTQTNDLQHDTQAAHAHGQALQHFAPAVHIPRWLIVAAAIIVFAGVALLLGLGTLAENASFEAMKDSDAHIHSDLRPEKGDEGFRAVQTNGLADGYAIVRIDKEREAIAGIVSLCDRTDPAAGLRLFRRALNSDSRSAKLVALYCANYLAHAQRTPSPRSDKGVLEASDFNRMLDLLDAKKEADIEVRKYALRAVSDLVVLTDAAAIATVEASAKAENRYTKISDEMKTAAKAQLEADAPAKDDVEPSKAKEVKDKRRDFKVATRKDTVNGKPVLLVRWSTPGLALAWWKENAKDGAKWDMESQRFVIP